MLLCTRNGRAASGLGMSIWWCPYVVLAAPPSPQPTEPTGVAIVDFSASWCPPCKLIAPIYEKLALDYPDIAFYKIDIDGENVRQTVADNDVSAVPTFVSFRGGKPVGQFSGADRTALQLMVDALSSAAA